MRDIETAEPRSIGAVGSMVEMDGLAITGQVSASLVLEKQPLSTNRIANVLQVNRASVGSTDVRLLQKFAMLGKRSKLGDRQAFYAPRADAYANYVRQAASGSSAMQNGLRRAQRPWAQDQRKRGSAVW